MRSSCRKALSALSFSSWLGRFAIVAVVPVTATSAVAETKTAHRHSSDKNQSSESSSIPSSTADAEGSGSSSVTHGDTEALPESALPALPDVPRLEPQQPNAEDIQELSAKLNGLFSDDAEARDSVMSELVEIQPRIVPAVHQRVLQLAEHADKEKIKRLFGEARRETLNRRGSSGTAATAANEPSVLKTLLATFSPKDPAWRDSVTLAALVRMLSASGTVEGARELVTVYAKFGEFVRVEVQQRLSDMKDRALGALIEARRHPAEKVARWAGLRLDQMGRAIPSESVRTNDFEALADILRAYGRVRDPDAARIIISYANSERTQLRLAARQSIVMLGSVGLWQLRDAYEDVVGKRPRRDWTWEHTARELFGEFDRLRLARVYGAFVDGERHLEKGELELMGHSYDLVLAKDPLFEKRSQMAPGYFRLAQSLRDANPTAALEALTRVERLSSNPSLSKQAQSLASTLLAIQSATRGVVDIDRLKAALELDPSNTLARQSLASLQPSNLVSRYSSVRWIASAVIAFAGVLSALLIWLRRPKSIEPRADQQ